MAVKIHHVKRVKFTISFNIPGANEIPLVNVIGTQRFGKIRILNPFGDIRAFF
jgi:hypothetical protein